MYIRPERTTISATLFVRLGLLITFVVLIGRLYQLQILRGETYQRQADTNRFRLVEVPAPRGVIYDSNGEILARNRPSFVVAVVPAALPDNNVTTAMDEEKLAIEKILRTLGADTDPEIALGIGEVMFRYLGRADFADTVRGAGVELSFRVVRLPVVSQSDEDGEETVSLLPTMIPDLAKPLPLPGLTALVSRAVTLGTQGSSFAPIPILDLVDQELAFYIAEESYQLPGVQILQEPVREYLYHEYASHVLGFMGPIPALALERYRERGYSNQNERVGLSGLEYTYQDLVRGMPGRKILEVDILGRENRTVGKVIEPVPGLNLRLSLDIHLQQAMHRSLERMMLERGSPHAVAIAMNPMTGAILGMVSLPSFDNNIFSEGLGAEYLALEAIAKEDPNRNPLINYAIGGIYPPGSVYKMVSGAGALAEGVITPNTRISDNGPLYLPNQFFPNDMSQAQRFVSWNHKLGISHGPMTIVEGIARSNDIFFYWIGGGYPNQFVGLNSDRLGKWQALFGYGARTGIDLPGEVTTFIPSDQWKRLTYAESWTTGDSYNMAIGQGFVLGTPLQVLVSTAAVANNGYVVQPQLVHQIFDAEGGLQRDFQTNVIRELPISKDLLAYIKQGMWAVVNTPIGTARRSAVDGVTVAGKTGTAEFCAYDAELEDCAGRDAKGHLPYHAWYVAYAPYEEPEIAVVVFVYDGGEGSDVGVPVAQEILDFYFNGPKEPEAPQDDSVAGG